MQISNPIPKKIANPAAIDLGRRYRSSHKLIGRTAYARMNAARKGVKISAIVIDPLEFNDSTDQVQLFTNLLNLP